MNFAFDSQYTINKSILLYALNKNACAIRSHIYNRQTAQSALAGTHWEDIHLESQFVLFKEILFVLLGELLRRFFLLGGKGVGG